MKLIDIPNYMGKSLYTILNKEVREVIVKDIHIDPIEETEFRPIDEAWFPSRVHVKVKLVDKPHIFINILAEDLYATRDETSSQLKKPLIGCTLKDKTIAVYSTSAAIRATEDYDTPDCLIALQQLRLALEKIKNITTGSKL